MDQRHSTEVTCALCEHKCPPTEVQNHFDQHHPAIIEEKQFCVVCCEKRIQSGDTTVNLCDFLHPQNKVRHANRGHKLRNSKRKRRDMSTEGIAKKVKHEPGEDHTASKPTNPPEFDETTPQRPDIEEPSTPQSLQELHDPQREGQYISSRDPTPQKSKSRVDEDAAAASRLRDSTKQLNDHEINKFLRLITAYKTQHISSHILNSSQTWKIDAEVAYVPLHVKHSQWSHWFAGKIRKIHKIHSYSGSFQFMDSRDPISREAVKDMRTTLEQRLGFELTDPENLSEHCAQQVGGIDCGVYTILFVWFDVLGNPPPTYVYVPWWRAILVIVWEHLSK